MLKQIFCRFLTSLRFSFHFKSRDADHIASAWLQYVRESARNSLYFGHKAAMIPRCYSICASYAALLHRIIYYTAGRSTGENTQQTGRHWPCMGPLRAGLRVPSRQPLLSLQEALTGPTLILQFNTPINLQQ